MQEILVDVLYLCDVAFVFHYVGSILAGTDRSASRMSCVLGLAIIAVGTTVLYTRGVSIYACSLLWHATAAGAFIASLVRRQREPRTVSGTRPRGAAVVPMLAVATLVLLVLPKWVGGIQFSAFQGNQWDFFGYFQSAVGYASRSYRFLTSLSIESPQLVENPVWGTALGNLRARPSIHLLFAVTAGGVFFKAHMHALTYTFMAFLMFLSTLAIRQLLGVLSASVPGRAREPIAHAVIAAVFGVGFWGQYILDINAWSQLGGMPIAIAAVASVLSVLTGSHSGRERRAWIVLAVLAGGCLYAYPESMMFHAPAIAGMALLAGWLGIAPWTRAGRVLLTCAIGVCSGMFYYRGTILFGLQQVQSSLQERDDYWKYFQRFLFGRGDLAEDLRRSFHSLTGAWPWQHAGLSGIGRLVELAATVVSGAMGLYFYTPGAGLSATTSVIWALLVGLFGVLVLRCGIVESIRRLRAGSRNDPHAQRRLLLAACVLVQTVETAILLALGQFWAGGKAFTFMAPYLLALMLLPLADALREMRGRTWRIDVSAAMLIAYVASQLSLGAYRVISATHADGIHYSPVSYPSIQPDAVHAKTHYNLASIDDAMARVRANGWRRVEISVSDVWVRNYLFALMTIDDRSFFGGNEILVYFSTGDVLGFQGSHGIQGDGAIREEWRYDPDVSRFRYALVAQ